MPKFDNKYTRYRLPRDETGPNRFYISPKGQKYISVTSALKEFSVEKNKQLEEWKKKVGTEEAERIARVSRSRGTGMHTIIENYLHNKKDYIKDAMPESISMFKDLKLFLDKGLKCWYLCEDTLWSDVLELAGTVDCVGMFPDKLTVLDFKNSRWPKKREWILDYFIQTTCYAMMFEEIYNEKIEQIAILIAIEQGGAQLFLGNPDSFRSNDFFTQRLYNPTQIAYT